MEKTINEFSSGLSEKLSHQDFRDILRLKVTELEKRGVSVSSLVISSHDGGGVFQGTFGQTSVEHISDLTKNDPDFKANLKSVYMMGCYTATTDQVVRWKNDFPSIQMVAGYDSMAPLRDATEGWNYLQDVMTLEAKIVGSKDKSKMESALKQVRDINSGTSQAIFPQCSSSKESLEFYRGKISHYRTQKFDLNYCKAAGPEFDKNWDLYKKYDSGELPIPKNTGESPLRNLYSFYRNYEFCLESGISFGPKAESVFFLVFNRAVRANFLKFEKKRITSMLAPFSKKSVNEIYNEKIKRFKDLQERLSSLDSQELQELNVLRGYLPSQGFLNQEKKLSELEEVVSTLKKMSDPNYFKEMSLKEIRYLASNMEDTRSLYGILAGDAAHFDGSSNREIYMLEQSLNKLVIARSCLPNSWHEEKTGTPDPPDSACIFTDDAN